MSRCDVAVSIYIDGYWESIIPLDTNLFSIPICDPTSPITSKRKYPRIVCNAVKTIPLVNINKNTSFVSRGDSIFLEMICSNNITDTHTEYPYNIQNNIGVERYIDISYPVVGVFHANNNAATMENNEVINNNFVPRVIRY